MMLLSCGFDAGLLVILLQHLLHRAINPRVWWLYECNPKSVASENEPIIFELIFQWTPKF